MIRNIFGSIIVVVGAFVFQIGFILMTEDMQERFAKKFVEKISVFTGGVK